MKRSTKGLIILLIPFLLGFLLGLLAGGGCSRKENRAPKDKKQDDIQEVAVTDTVAVADTSAIEDSDEYEEPQAREIIYYAPRMSYAKLFDDINDEHIAVARKVGLKQIPKKREDVAKAPGLRKIEDNEYYVVDELRYSVPYLTTNAADELMAIAKAFSDSLHRKRLLEYKLVVSSVLRTEEDVNKLRKSGNPNATDNSAHCYGTTFDITYTRYWREDESEEFMQPYELTKVLGEVLRDRKKAGRCIIKYEKKEHCFHITSCK